MSRTATIAVYMAAMFVSGALVGGFGHRLYTASTVSATTRARPDEFRRAYLEELKRRLQLDQTQVGKINSILDETRVHFREFRERHKEEFEAIHKGQTDRIRATLNEAQRSEYARFHAEREKRMREEKAKHKD